MKFKIIKPITKIKVPKIRGNDNLLAYKDTVKFKDIDSEHCELSFEIENKGNENAKKVETILTFINSNNEKKDLIVITNFISRNSKILYREMWWNTNFIKWYKNSECIKAEVCGEEYYDETFKTVKVDNDK